MGKLAPADINAHVLLAFAVVLCAAQLGGWAITKIGQSRVQGEILAGIALGPSALGLLSPATLDYLFPGEVLTALNAVAQLGVTLFMFLIGAELDVATVRRQGRAVLAIAGGSMALPAALGALLALAIYRPLGGEIPRGSFAMFIGVAMAISAFPVLVRVLKETGLSTTRIGAITTSCAALVDISAWSLLAVVVALAKAASLFTALRTVALALVIIGVMLLVARPVIGHLYRRGYVLPWGLTVVLALVCAWATEYIGIHAIFGAFLAGAVLPRAPRYQHDLVARLEPTVLTLLLPAFFMVVGLGTHLGLLRSWYLAGVTAVVAAVAIAGKLGGAALAARAVGETWADATVIGVLLNTRGLTELVILAVGRELGVITPTMFTIMVTMALATTLMTTPLVRLLRRGSRQADGRADAAIATRGEIPR